MLPSLCGTGHLWIVLVIFAKLNGNIWSIEWCQFNMYRVCSSCVHISSTNMTDDCRCLHPHGIFYSVTSSEYLLSTQLDHYTLMLHQLKRSIWGCLCLCFVYYPFRILKRESETVLISVQIDQTPTYDIDLSLWVILCDCKLWHWLFLLSDTPSVVPAVRYIYRQLLKKRKMYTYKNSNVQLTVPCHPVSF